MRFSHASHASFHRIAVFVAMAAVSCVAFGLAAASDEASHLTPEQMQEDLDFLLTKIEQVHPATIDDLPEELSQAAESARQSLAEPRDRYEFWAILSRVLAAMHDAHSSLTPLVPQERIDLPFVWLQEGLIVSDDRHDLRRGDRILAVGEASEDGLLETLRAIVPAENDHWVKKWGPRLLTDPQLLRALGVAREVPVKTEIERDGKRLTMAISPTSSFVATDAEQPWARWEMDTETGLGVFTLDRCINDASYRRTVREFFEAVHEHNLTHVAIDVRANGGGASSVIGEFLRYLKVPAYWPFSGSIRVSPEAAEQRGYSQEPGFYPARGLRFPKLNGRPENLPQFAGQVYVLTSAHTFSSANWFAVIFQDNGIGKIVGEPTGNAPTSYGDSLSFQLPQSGFTFTLSHKRWLRPKRENEPAATLTPDIFVPRTRADVIAGTDEVLEYLRREAAR